ncbi:MAG TPA: hypothetical protein DIW30_04815 [Bacteroidales bacterium]|nr:hypothetical protein [Bacteroidales bacterium]
MKHLKSATLTNVSLNTSAKQEDYYKVSSDILYRYLREHNLRCTSERLFLLKQVCAYRQKFTAEQLLSDIPDSVHLSVATIYNSLNLFCSCRILQKQSSSAGARTTAFELVMARESSMHFVCTRCGRKVEFRDKAVENILRERHFNNFQMSDFSLSVYGVCKICRRKHR